MPCQNGLYMSIPLIITFANQKGGVGKTTLCITFANFLNQKGVKVRIYDLDPQNSIGECRKSDLTKYGEAYIPYGIESLRFKDDNDVVSLLSTIYSEKNLDIVLFDTPGSMASPGIVALLANSDFLMIPFHYDLMTIKSTMKYLVLIERLRASMEKKMKTRLFFIPNLQDYRAGTRHELSVYGVARDKLMQFGIVTPKIAIREDMKRFSTISDLDRQNKITADAFGCIFENIIREYPDLEKETPSNTSKNEIQ